MKVKKKLCILLCNYNGEYVLHVEDNYMYQVWKLAARHKTNYTVISYSTKSSIYIPVQMYTTVYVPLFSELSKY